MEQNLAVVTKRMWKIVRVALFMLKKGISKRKLMLDLNLTLKRRKISASMATVQNLIFHHHNHHAPPSKISSPAAAAEASTTHTRRNLSFIEPASTEYDDVYLVENVAAAVKVLESEKASSRQLRVTDSPYPLVDVELDENHVDEAAEEFISRFYRDLRRQASLYD